MSDMATIELPIRPITAAEFERMLEARILDEDERVELLDGLLVAMPPTGELHAFTHGLVFGGRVRRVARCCSVFPAGVERA
jgi:hypothetical protein